VELGPDFTVEEVAEFKRFRRDLRRRGLGLPTNMSPGEEACAQAGERFAARLVGGDG